MVCHCRIKEQSLVIQWVVSLWSACMGEGDQRQILAERENKLSQMQLYCSVLHMSVDICTSVCVRGPGDNLVFFLSAVFYFLGLLCCCFVLFLRQGFFHCPGTHQIVSGLVDSGNPEIYLPAWHSPVL